MYQPESNSPHSDALQVLESVAAAPEELCANDPEVRAVFEQSLRELAQDIVKHHPGLAHVLIGMGDDPCPVVHGQN